MRKKLPIVLLIIICLCSLVVLSSCDFVLDMIFGPNNPSNQPDSNDPQTHVHQMNEQTYEGATCSGHSSITYYICGSCGKSYLDKDGLQVIADVSALDSGHVYVIEKNADEHYYECALCGDEQENSRGSHSCDRWYYNPDNHYKLCDVCGIAYDSDSHDETGSCSTCGRQADYESMCNSRYGFAKLAGLEHGDRMQKLYNKIDEVVKSAHNNANYKMVGNCDVGKNDSGETIYASSLKDIAVSDCYVNQNEAKITIATYKHDNPLYYWLSRYSSVEILPNGNISYVKICVLDEYADSAKRVAQNAEIYAEIDKYLSAISNEKDSYNITLSLHNAIIDNIDYAHKSDGSAEDASWAHNIVGVFHNKSAVCEGYAKSFQLLLNASNVENIYVIGSSHGEGHAWNLVKMTNEQWYWYDLTWDDQPTEELGKTYDYFCKTDDVFSRDHKVSNIKSGIDYFYDLPEAATQGYDGVSWKINESRTLNGITYKLVGYNRLAVSKVLSSGENGVVTIPSAVLNRGIRYSVKQIESDALVTYTYNERGETVTKAGPQVTKIIIPSTIDLIYNKSFSDCSTLVAVEFADPNNWQRYLFSDLTPKYEKISAESLSSEFGACLQIKQSLPGRDNYYVWIKSAE